MTIRIEEYVFGVDLRKSRIFEREQISRTILNFKWTNHIPMGCEKSGKGHQEDINALDIDDGDQMLILGSGNGSVTVTNYKYLGRSKWKKPISLNLEKHALKSIKWCPLDLRKFMVTTASNWMRLCDTNKQKVISGKKFEGDVQFHWNEYQTTNSKVAVADGSRSMKIVDFRIGMSLPSITRWDDVPIDVVQWYPSKHHYVYVGRRDGKVGIFDIRSARGVLAEKRIHSGEVPMFGMKITSDGRHLITADRSGLIHVADTWNFKTKSEFRGNPNLLTHRRPSLEIMELHKDIYVATNFEKLTVVKFSEDSNRVEFREMKQKVLADKAMIWRPSSYELITGHHYNYLNILSDKREEDEEDDNLIVCI